MEQVRKNIEWIDGAKGVAIISVILLHCIPCLREIGDWYHIGQAVPVFIFISSYLTSLYYESLRKYYDFKRIIKVLRRICLPVLIVLVCELLICYIHTGYIIPLKPLLLNGGCMGPGSYYPIMYICMWSILPFIVLLVKRLPLLASLMIMLALSAGSEYGVTLLVDKVSHLDQLYRLSPIRYLMIMYLGCVFPRLTKSWKTVYVILAILGGVMAYYVIYISHNSLIITPLWWRGDHWYTVLYVYFPLLLLQRVHFGEVLQWLGKHSWEIFCFQMFVFYCVDLKFL